METVTVKFKFFGTIAKLAGVTEFSYPIHKDRENGLIDINRIVLEKAGNQALYTILINGASHYLTKKPEFTTEDEISIVPIVLGG